MTTSGRSLSSSPQPALHHGRGPRLGSGVSALALVATALALSACGERDAFWDQRTHLGEVWSFPDAFAVFDQDASRLGVFTVDGDLALHQTFVPLDETLLASAVAPPDANGHRHLLLVTAPKLVPGKVPGVPAHFMIVDPAAPKEATILPLSRTMAGLAVDPRGQWAVLYASSKSDGGFVVNPNELTLVALDAAAVAPGQSQVQPHTLRSFGGTPQRFTFTETLQLPGGPRRLLVVETDKDVALVNLDKPSEPDLTVQLTNGVDTRSLSPAGVSITDGDPAANDDARIAIRLQNDRSLVLVQLGPAAGRDYGATINVVDVGAPPLDTAFVRTDAGALALAALVPARKAAVIVDPVTSVTTDVALPVAYDHLSLVTSAVNGAVGADGPDVALLWSSTSASVSFWALGRTVGKPYRSLENVALATPVASVIDLPAPHLDRKLLAGRSEGFFLLDLAARTVDPFLSSTSDTELAPGPAGRWAWAYVPQTTDLARVDLDTKHPDVLALDQPARNVFELTTVPAGGKAAHALVVLHDGGNAGATIFDAAGQGETLNHRHEIDGICLQRGDR